MSSSRRKYRLAIHNAFLIRPLHPPTTADILVAHDGIIAFIGKAEDADLRNADRLIDATDVWLIPGFVSSYSQLWQHGFLGRAPQSNVKELSQVLYNETKDLSAEELYELTLQGATSHIRKGITTVFNFTYPSRSQDGRVDRAQFEGAMDAGIRLVHGFNVGKCSKEWTPSQALQRTKRFLSWATHFEARQQYLSTRISLHGLEDHCDTTDTIEMESSITKKLNMSAHLNYLESPDRDDIIREHNRWDWLVKFGLVDPRLTVSHFVQSWAPGSKIHKVGIIHHLARKGVGMSWNPVSNARLGSGYATVELYKTIGLKRFGLGVDGEAKSGRCDPFEHMRLSVYLPRLHKPDLGEDFGPRDAFVLHTLGAAGLLNCDKIGTLTNGRFADMILLKPPCDKSVPDPLAAMVFSSGVEDIVAVFVGGLEQLPQLTSAPSRVEGERWPMWTFPPEDPPIEKKETPIFSRVSPSPSKKRRTKVEEKQEGSMSTTKTWNLPGGMFHTFPARPFP
ncbi:hypothetical protein PENSTE_c008G10276 [Penicillium steckii]|uniref:Amidohydrolase-related domain-containing protein n=1 Tax=Penicillium steckii TaxID=303698 RepID=A0A1V6TBP5_9EURO|nr:hypothetical protein PENSTE_c008G10276 [Penicillium steckii]